jgi:hypothetical protein
MTENGVTSLRQKIQEQIRLCEQRSNHGLWALALFVAISIAANANFQSLATLAEQWRDLLGPPPPTSWINGALFIYSFSAVIQIFTRMMQGTEPKGAFFPVIYLLLFYLFYGASGAQIEHFWAVLASGLTILGLESYSCWNYYQAEIRGAREELDRLKRLEKLS